MSTEASTYSAADDARDAANWRELRSKVQECLDDSSNGYASIWGGDDNLNVSVVYQSRGYSGIKLELMWTTSNENREDINFAVKKSDDS